MPKISALPQLTGQPADDDVYPIVDTSAGATKKSSKSDSIPPTLRAVRFYVASTTWSRPAGLLANAAGFIIVRLRAGGGAGGGAGTSAGLKTAGGGGQGEYAVKKIAVASLGSSETVTIGAGQTGITGDHSAQANGGGTTSFGSHVTALGGGRAQGTDGTTTSRAGGVGGTGGTDADLSIPGAPGGPARPGGSGAGGGDGGGNAINGNAAGTAATANGGGGGGGSQDGGTTTRAGGNGGLGHMIVEEWY